MDKTDRVFGNVISEHRKVLGISQERLADEAGLHRTYISLIERGQRTVSLDTIIKLAKALGVTAAKLLSDFENHPRHQQKR